MSNKLSKQQSFGDLKQKDKDLTMFTITNLTLTKEWDRNMVSMALKLKRKVVTELVTTYLPTILLLLITFTTIFFDKDLFGDAIAVNLTIMLVMTTIFTSKIEELPPTSDMKMIDIWLICCLVIPFLEVILRTTIEGLNCCCDICEGKGAKNSKTDGEEKERGEKIEVVRVLVGTRAKVAPQQVTFFPRKCATVILSYQVLTKGQQRENSAANQPDKDKKKEGCVEGSRGSCSKGSWRHFFEVTGDILFQFFFPRMCLEQNISRNLGPAFHRPVCRRGLRSPCCRLL